MTRAELSHRIGLRLLEVLGLKPEEAGKLKSLPFARFVTAQSEVARLEKKFADALLSMSESLQRYLKTATSKDADARLALEVIDAAIESTTKMRKLQFEGEETARTIQRKAARHAASDRASARSPASVPPATRTASAASKTVAAALAPPRRQARSIAPRT
jgi:hypothetical protein